MIATLRLQRAKAYAYRLRDDGANMGLALTRAASEFAVPRGVLPRYMRYMRAEQLRRREDEARGMWWNQ